MRRSFFLYLFMFLCFHSIGQLCSGSYSDPIVSIDFGEAGTNSPSFGNALLTDQTDYIFITNQQLNDGEYTIANDLRLGRDQWHQTPDHTPNDNGGYMLVVNASFAPGEFYQTTVEGLCKNTNFEFSAFVMNALEQISVCGGNGIDPNLRFEIRTLSGKLVASKETGDIRETSNPQWKQYGLTFNTGNETAFELILINNAEGGCGNDLAIDDITFRACGDIASIQSEIDLEEKICRNDIPDQITLQADLQGGVYANPVFQWQMEVNNQWQSINNATNQTLVVNNVEDENRYRFLVAASKSNLSNNKCTVISDTVHIDLAEERNYSIEGTSNYCEGGLLQLIGKSSEFDLHVQWQTPTGNSIGDTLIIRNIGPQHDGQYIVAVTDLFGCAYRDTLDVTVQQNSTADMTISKCKGESVVLPNGNNYEVQADDNFEVVIPNHVGCDSIINVSVRSFPTYNHTIDSTVCKQSMVKDNNGEFVQITNDKTIVYSFLSKDGCDSTVTKRFIVPQEQFVTVDKCVGETVTLPTGEQITAQSSIDKQYTLSTSSPCDSIVNFQMNVFPTFEEEESVSVCPIVPYTLPGYGDIFNEGVYPVRYQSKNGCDSIVNVRVNHELDACDFGVICKLRFPTAITPDNNQVNDAFQPLVYSSCRFETFQLSIRNRWGELVFETSDLSKAWNPTERESGFYMWSTQYVILTPEGDKIQQNENGVVSIIR